MRAQQTKAKGRGRKGDCTLAEAAGDLIALLKTPAAVKVMRKQGMEPLF